MTIKRTLIATLVIFSAGCASTPKTPPVPPLQFSDKLAWILQLEDRRTLRETAPPAPADTKLTKDQIKERLLAHARERTG